MKIKFLINSLFIITVSWSLAAREYKASMFGIKSDGTTNNTGSIQKAIDYIGEQGGGTLVFYVGRYLTGTIHLKTNVSIRLEEGAILVGSPLIYDYSGPGKRKALIIASGQQNITISGKGVIEGQGDKLMEHIKDQDSRFFLKGTVSEISPALIVLDSCRNIAVKGINLRDACGDVIRMTNCRNINLSGIALKSKIPGMTAGIQISGCDTVVIRDSFIDTSGKEIIAGGSSQNVSVVRTVNSKGATLQP